MPNTTHYIVSDYMRKDVVDIKETATLKEAVTLMVKKKTNALVVTDETRHVVGIITSWGIIEAIVPDYLESDKHLAAFAAGNVFQDRVNQLADKAVVEIMSKEVHVINPDDTLIHTATQISQFHIRQLPVVDNDGILVGYINHTDIKRAIADVLGIK